MSGFIPVHNLNVPNGGPQTPINIPSNAPVISSYSGLQVWTGPMPTGIRTDAVVGQQGFGKVFHVIVHNPVNNSWMVHNPYYGSRR